MKKVLTGSRMREIDSIAINTRGIPGIDLMERAGTGLTEVILRYLESESCLKARSLNAPAEDKQRCVIVCGAGNNGGDGYVAGRLLKNKGINVRAFSVIDPAKLKGDAKINYERYINMGEIVCLFDESQDLDRFRSECRSADVIVDAIFGTGISRNVEGLSKKIIDIINEEKVFTISVDIPSGVGSDNGSVYGTAVKADKTVTFQMSKFGMGAQPGKSMAGEVEVIDIGLPQDLCNDKDGTVYIAEKYDILNMLPRRDILMNKGDAGKLLIVAGSKGMAGAAVLAAKAAYKSGSGLVKVAAPWEVIQVIQVAVPEATCLILSEDVNTNKELISEQAEDYDAIVVGPGLGKDQKTAELVKHIIKNISKPLLLDADGINLVSNEPEILKQGVGDIIITPHPGEMGRLIKASAKSVNEDRLNIAQSFASEYNVILVLKGASSIIACPDGEIFINPTGNSAMATAGSGDVLSGITGAFLAGGASSRDSAVAATYIHGLSGDICRNEIGEYGTTASDIAVFAADALKKLER